MVEAASRAWRRARRPRRGALGVALFAGAAVLLSACARGRPAVGPGPSRGGVLIGVGGPSSSPAFELPRRAPLRAVPREAEWSDIGREAADLLVQYVRINTTNPPGNEIVAARFLEAVLAREGIESRVFEPSPGKANLYARLRGDGSARPIVLLSHMDVVEASPEFWSVEPFAGAVRDGYVYGRGALDMKGQGIAELMAFVLLRRSGASLRRDVILLATADEEVNGGVGAGWVVREHPELVRGAEFLINEGGSMRRDEAGGVRYVGVGVTEKAPLWLHVTSRGTAGHGSRPTQDNAVERLIRALARLEAYETPYVVTPAADRFFRDLATREMDPSRRAWFADISRAVQDSAARRFLESDLYFNAVLRNTISVTRLAGSGKVNVIPPVARAEVDVRLLPGEEPQRFLAQLRRVVGDTLVSVEPQGVSWPATESPTDNALFRAIEEVSEQHFPGVLVTTPMLAGFTDSHLFRRLGIVSYGIEPFPLSEQESRGVHGNDERLNLRDLEFGTRYLFEILLRVAGP